KPRIRPAFLALGVRGAIRRRGAAAPGRPADLQPGPERAAAADLARGRDGLDRLLAPQRDPAVTRIRRGRARPPTRPGDRAGYGAGGHAGPYRASYLAPGLDASVGPGARCGAGRRCGGV